MPSAGLGGGFHDGSSSSQLAPTVVGSVPALGLRGVQALDYPTGYDDGWGSVLALVAPGSGLVLGLGLGGLL